MKDEIIKIMRKYVTEMEGYSYCGSNMGIPEDYIEDIVEDILNLYNNLNSKLRYYLRSKLWLI